MSAADSLEFKLALQFYKDEAITVTSLPYDTKIMLAALLKQAKHGPYVAALFFTFTNNSKRFRSYFVQVRS